MKSADPGTLDRMDGGVTLLQPALGAGTMNDWYSGTANAVYQNLFRLKTPFIQDILILSGDHIYKMDYSEMVTFHRSKKAHATIAVMPVNIKEASRFGIMKLDENRKIVEFEEKPENPKSNLASMGIYLFNRETLETVLMADAADPKSSHDFGKDIIPKMIHSYQTFGFEFQGYWRDVGTIPSYYQANMDLLEDPPLFDLDEADWVIHTKSEEKPPVKLDNDAKIIRSLVANGCIINGYVEHSILFPGVVVESDAVIQNSIIFSNTVVGNKSRIEHSILDKRVYIGANCHIGMGERIGTPNQGITVIGKGTHIPPNTHIESDCIIDRGLREEHFLATHIPAGEMLKKKKSK